MKTIILSMENLYQYVDTMSQFRKQFDDQIKILNKEIEKEAQNDVDFSIKIELTNCKNYDYSQRKVLIDKLFSCVKFENKSKYRCRFQYCNDSCFFKRKRDLLPEEINMKVKWESGNHESLVPHGIFITAYKVFLYADKELADPDAKILIKVNLSASIRTKNNIDKIFVQRVPIINDKIIDMSLCKFSKAINHDIIIDEILKHINKKLTKIN